MYHRHFGLSGPPFQFTPAPDALYLSPTHREALAVLEWGLLHEPTGFTLLAGESGVGKTTMVCSILARRHWNVRTALLSNPRLNFDQMMQVVMSQLAPGWSGQTRLELTEGFAELLDDLAPGERVAIVIDEAQELSDDALEGLRLLSNADTFAERRLQIIFVGQPELIERLGHPEMHSLNQRIGARALLKPLGAAEVREYIDCRLRAKGGAGQQDIRSRRAQLPGRAQRRDSAPGQRTQSQFDAAGVRGGEQKSQSGDGQGMRSANTRICSTANNATRADGPERTTIPRVAPDAGRAGGDGARAGCGRRDPHLVASLAHIQSIACKPLVERPSGPQRSPT